MSSVYLSRDETVCPVCLQPLQLDPSRPVCACRMTDDEARRDYQDRFAPEVFNSYTLRQRRRLQSRMANIPEAVG